MKVYWIFTSLLLFVWLSTPVYAHSEHDKARFVDTTGRDEGKCDSPIRPCQSIQYAIANANKGDSVLVASGSYQINSEDELFALTNQLIKVLAGFNRFDHFQLQSPDVNPSYLTGVPEAFAKQLSQQGFTVLADQKKLSDTFQKRLRRSSASKTKQAAQTCTNGMAGSFPCNNIDLVAHVPLSDFSLPPNSANDIWGHVDLNTGKEYALIALSNGASVFDVSTPESPQEVGTISGQSTTWRDIKVYQFYDAGIQAWRAYAYLTTDGVNDGYIIIDLNNLPTSISLVKQDFTFSSAHNIYISNLDYTLNTPLPGMTATVQIAGTNNTGGAFRTLSLSDPEQVTSLFTQTSATRADYTHDATSLNIEDARRSACPNATGDTCTLFVDYNEREMRLWDITNPTNSQQISSVTYSGVRYTHSGWWSEDKQVIFLHDELDERDNGINTTLRMFNIDDLSAPVLAATWTGPTAAIDHNGFVRGNRYYMSNYQRGLTVLDITDPLGPVEIGHFDTYPAADNASFSGAWGVYPYLPSGLILVSDIDGGLFVLRDNTYQQNTGAAKFESQVLTTAQNTQVQINVNRISNNQGAVSVGYETLPASADIQDFTSTSGTLSWLDGESSTKSFNISIAAEQTGELDESFFVRLYNPQNGLSLTSPSYLRVNISGIPNPGSLSFTESEKTVSEGQQTLTLNVARIGGSSGAASVDYQVTSSSATSGADFNLSSGQLTWGDGDIDNKTITIEIIDDAQEENDENIVISLQNAAGANLGNRQQLTLVLQDNEQNNLPVVNAGEDLQANTRAEVTLSGTATDADNDSLSYLWQQVSGENVSLSNATEISTRFTAPEIASSLTFSLTVTDARGGQSSDQTTVTVIATQTSTNTSTESSSSGGSLHWLLLACLLLATPLSSFRMQNAQRLGK